MGFKLDEERVLSYRLETAAAKLGISESTLRRLAEERDIPLIKLRGCTVVRHSDLEKLLQTEQR